MGSKTMRHVNTYESYHFRNATAASANNSEAEVQMTATQLEADVRESRTPSTAQAQSNPPPSSSLIAPGGPNCPPQNGIIGKGLEEEKLYTRP